MKLQLMLQEQKFGGAKNHLISVLSNIDPISYGFDEVHLWIYSDLKESIPKRSCIYTFL